MTSPESVLQSLSICPNQNLMLITSLVSTDQPLTRRIHVETVHCSSFIIQHDFSLLSLFAFPGNNSLLNYLGLRKKANECLFEWNCAPFGTAIKQSATHTKHICCGLTTDVSQVIQSIVRGKWWKAVWVTYQKCLSTDDSVCPRVCLYCLCIFPQKIQLFSCRMKLAPFHRYFKSK